MNNRLKLLFVVFTVCFLSVGYAQPQKVFKFRTHAWGSSVMEIKARKTLVSRMVVNDEMDSFATLQLKTGKDTTTFQPVSGYGYYIDKNERLELQKIPLQAIVYAYNASGKLTQVYLYLKSDMYADQMKAAVDSKFGKPYKTETEKVTDDAPHTITRFYFKVDEDTEAMYQMVKWTDESGQAGGYAPYNLSHILIHSKSLMGEHEDKTSGGF